MPQIYSTGEFEELCRSHVDRINALGTSTAQAFNALDEDLPDVIQEALIRLHLKVVARTLEKRPSDCVENPMMVVFEGQEVFFPRSYFRTVVERKVIDAHRARSRRRRRFGQPTSLENAELQLLDRLDDRYLTDSELAGRLELLPPECQQVITMRYFEGLSVQEITDDPDQDFQNESAVRRRLKKCLKKLL